MKEDRDSIAFQLLIDGSCIEVFTDCGAVLSARVYRWEPCQNHSQHNMPWCKAGCLIRIMMLN